MPATPLASFAVLHSTRDPLITPSPRRSMHTLPPSTAAQAAFSASSLPASTVYVIIVPHPSASLHVQLVPPTTLSQGSESSHFPQPSTRSPM